MLALVGSGEYLPPMERVDRHLLERLPAAPRVVCLPTAAGAEGPQRITYWSNLGVEYFRNLGAEALALPVTDQASANDPQWAAEIRRANFVYLSGGKPGYLFKALYASLTWQAILSVHQAGGVVAGCSAGAMIMGARFPGFPGWLEGFGLLPGAVVIPHFDELSFNVAKLARFLISRKLDLVGIEGDTALLLSDGHLHVLGQKGVTIWNHHQPTRYTEGQQVDLIGFHKELV